MSFETTLSWDDRISIIRRRGGTETEDDISFEEFYNRLFSHPFGASQFTLYNRFNLAGVGKFFKLVTVPSGSIIKNLGLQISSTIVAGGTSVKLALGQHGGDVDVYGKTSDLNKNTGFSKLLADSVLGSDTDVDVNAIVTDGSTLGDTDISAGEIFFTITVVRPVILPTF